MWIRVGVTVSFFHHRPPIICPERMPSRIYQRVSRPKLVSVATADLVPTLRERLSDMGVKGVRSNCF